MLHLCSMNVQSVERIRSRCVEYQAICSTANVARSLASLSRSLPQHCWLCLRASLRSFARSLAHSLASGLMGKIFLSMNRTLRFCTISNHNALLLHILSPFGTVNGKPWKLHKNIPLSSELGSERMSELGSERTSERASKASSAEQASE